MKKSIIVIVLALFTLPVMAICPYDLKCLNNPYGAGSKYKLNGLKNPYSKYGSKYSNKSWTNPYATNAPKLYDQYGTYKGKLSVNKYDPESISNAYGLYRFKNLNPYETLYVVPAK